MDGNTSGDDDTYGPIPPTPASLLHSPPAIASPSAIASPIIAPAAGSIPTGNTSRTPVLFQLLFGTTSRDTSAASATALQPELNTTFQPAINAVRNALGNASEWAGAGPLATANNSSAVSDNRTDGISVEDGGSDEWTAVVLGAEITLASLMFVLIVLTICGNTLVILAVLTTRRLRTVTNCFVMSLAVADLLVGVTVMPPAVASHLTGSWQLGWVLCDIWISMDVLLCTASILSLCAISIDRYLAVTRPLVYSRRRRSKRLALYMILVVWALALAITCPPILGWYEPGRRDLRQCRYNQNEGYVIFSAMGSFFIPMAVMIYVYVGISCVVARRHDQMHEFEMTKGTQTNHHHHHQHRHSAGAGDSMAVAASGHSAAATTACIIDVDLEPEPSSELDMSSAASRRPSHQHHHRHRSADGDVCKVSTTPPSVQTTPLGGTAVSSGRVLRNGHYELLAATESPPHRGAVARNQLRQPHHQYQQRQSMSYQSTVVLHIDPTSLQPSAPTIIPAILADPVEHNSDRHLTAVATLLTPQQQQQLSRLPAAGHRTTGGGGGGAYAGAGTIVQMAANSGQQQPLLPSAHSKSVSHRIITQRRENKTTQTLTIVVGGFIVCWLPFFVYYLLTPFLPVSYVSGHVTNCLTWLGWFNSAMNPFIYAFYSVDFRAAFWRLTLRRFFKDSVRAAYPSGALMGAQSIRR